MTTTGSSKSSQESSIIHVCTEARPRGEGASPSTESASDVFSNAMEQAMQKELHREESFTTDRWGRARPVPVQMASWTRPDASEVPISSRVEKWVRRGLVVPADVERWIRRGLMVSAEADDSDYHPLEEIDAVIDRQWYTEEWSARV